MTSALFRQSWLTIQKLSKETIEGNFYQRFHKRDLNRVIAVPCIVDQADSNLIPEFKAIRAGLGLRESQICAQCPFLKDCKSANKQNEIPTELKISLTQLEFYLDKLNENESYKNDDPNFWFSSVRLLDTYKAIVEDQFKNQGKQLQQLAEREATQRDKSQYDKIEDNSKFKQKYVKKLNLDSDSTTSEPRFEKPRYNNRENQEGGGFKRNNRGQSSENQDEKPYYKNRDNYNRGGDKPYERREGSSYKSYDRQSSYEDRGKKYGDDSRPNYRDRRGNSEGSEYPRYGGQGGQGGQRDFRKREDGGNYRNNRTEDYNPQYKRRENQPYEKYNKDQSSGYKGNKPNYRQSQGNDDDVFEKQQFDEDVRDLKNKNRKFDSEEKFQKKSKKGEDESFESFLQENKRYDNFKTVQSDDILLRKDDQSKEQQGGRKVRKPQFKYTKTV